MIKDEVMLNALLSAQNDGDLFFYGDEKLDNQAREILNDEINKLTEKISGTWTPKIGESVWFSQHQSFAKVKKIDEKGYYVSSYSHAGKYAKLEELQPFIGELPKF